MKSLKLNLVVLAALASLALGCAGDDPAAVAVEALAPAGSNAAFVSNTVPTTMAPGEIRTVSVTVTNTGATPGFNDWTPSSPRYTLYRRGPTYWNWVHTPVTSTIAVGSSNTFTFTITAPTAPGTYDFSARMFVDGTGGFFGPTLTIPILVDAAAPSDYAAAVVSTTYPSTMAPGESRNVTVTMQNTGTQPWSGSEFRIYARHSPTGLFGTINAPIAGTVAPGANYTFNFPITAPTSAGTYPISYQMFRSSMGYFGALATGSIVVSASTTPEYACAFVPGASSIPTSMLPGSTALVSVAVTNTGTQPWTASNFSLYNRNSPVGLWNHVHTPTTSVVNPGATASFSFTIQAPPTLATTPFIYDMFQSGGVGYFGGNCVNTSIIVGFPPAPPVAIDLAAPFDGRTLEGGVGSYLEGVTVADANDDGVPDILASMLVPPAGVSRNQCGTVFGFIGGAGFFTGTSTPVPSDAGFAIVGAEAGDQLGHYQDGNLVVGDVTADGTADLLIGAPGADGPLNARVSAGEVYVIRGGIDLSAAGTIDLGAATAPTQLVATIFGAAAGDVLMPIGVGDLTGDGIDDIILGAQQTGTGGSRVGVVYIVVGTSGGISADVDLAAPGATTVLTVTGATEAQLGRIAAIGDFMGDGTLDLLLGGGTHSFNDVRDGAAWAFAGPIASSTSVAAADATWYGRSRTDQLGIGVAIAHVRGSSRADVIITASQYLQPGVSQAGGVLVFDGPIAPGVHDLSVSESTVTARILGATTQDNFGSAVRAADINGDGVADLIVAARAADGPSDARTNAGEVSVIRGGDTLSGTIDLASTVPPILIYGAGGLMGSYHNTLSVGDIDGDNRQDICVGSHSGRIDCIRSP